LRVFWSLFGLHKLSSIYLAWIIHLVEDGSDDEASEMAGGSGDGNHGSSFMS